MSASYLLEIWFGNLEDKNSFSEKSGIDINTTNEIIYNATADGYHGAILLQYYNNHQFIPVFTMVCAGGKIIPSSITQYRKAYRHHWLIALFLILHCLQVLLEKVTFKYVLNYSSMACSSYSGAIAIARVIVLLFAFGFGWFFRARDRYYRKIRAL